MTKGAYGLFCDPKAAFEEAIAAKVLNTNPASLLFAGDFMYMYTDDRGDHFKNINSRNYILNPKQAAAPAVVDMAQLYRLAGLL